AVVGRARRAGAARAQRRLRRALGLGAADRGELVAGPQLLRAGVELHRPRPHLRPRPGRRLPAVEPLRAGLGVAGLERGLPRPAGRPARMARPRHRDGAGGARDARLCRGGDGVRLAGRRHRGAGCGVRSVQQAPLRAHARLDDVHDRALAASPRPLGRGTDRRHPRRGVDGVRCERTPSLRGTEPASRAVVAAMSMESAAWSAMWRAQHRPIDDHPFSKESLSRIWRFARPYRGRIGVFVALSVVVAALAVATPLLAGEAINAITANEATGVIVRLAVLIAAIAVAEAGLGLLTRWFSARLGEDLIADLRTAVFDHVQRMPIAFFTRTRTGALVSRINSDVIAAQSAFSSTLSGVVGNVVTLT